MSRATCQASTKRRNEVIFRCSPTIRETRALIRRFHLRRLPGTVLGFLLPVMIILPAAAQEEEKAGEAETPAVVETIPESAEAAQEEENTVDVIEEQTAIEKIPKPDPVLYDSGKLRDPFLHIVPPKTSGIRVEDEEVPRGDPPQGIEGTSIDNAGFEGIVTRSDDSRTAIIRGSDNRAYFLSEGDRLFDGYLKAIENGSVVFIRETLMKSGKTLTQEVIKQLRKS